MTMDKINIYFIGAIIVEGIIILTGFIYNLN
jgi:hypothetical protein